MAASNRVDVITNNLINKGIADTILGGNVYTVRTLMATKAWKSGKTWDKAIKYQKSTTGGSFSGLDLFSTSSDDNQVKFAFDPKYFEQPVNLIGTEVARNKLTGAMVEDMMSLEVQSKLEDALDSIGTLLFSDGTGNSSKDFLGLAALVDDGTTVATLGGLSRSTYTTIKSTKTASGGTLTLAKMATLNTAISEGAQLNPTLNVTTETVADLYEQLLQPQERISKDVSMMKGGLTVGTGATGFHYKGRPLLADPKATSGVLFMLNEKFIDFFAFPYKPFGEQELAFEAKFEGTVYSEVKGLGFTVSEWLKPDNASAATKHIYLGGEQVCWNPKRSGKLTGVTGV